jgi:hypothetical protein
VEVDCVLSGGALQNILMSQLKNDKKLRTQKFLRAHAMFDGDTCMKYLKVFFGTAKLNK